MMWLLLAFLSAALLGFYDVFKKQSLKAVSYTHLDVYKRQVLRDILFFICKFAERFKIFVMSSP